MANRDAMAEIIAGASGVRAMVTDSAANASPAAALIATTANGPRDPIRLTSRARMAPVRGENTGAITTSA